MLKRIIPFFLGFILLLLSTRTVYAQSACSSISNCSKLRASYLVQTFSGMEGCEQRRQDYDCNGDNQTDCYQESNTCSSTQAICNNGYGNTPNDGYNCTKFCTDLSVSPNCGNYPGVDCTTFYNTCVNSYCVAAGGGTNYTCPSNQTCVSPPDSKAHQCITTVVPDPTITLKVNGQSSVTINSGDSIGLTWVTTNTDPNKNCSGSDSFQGTAPKPGPGDGVTESAYPPILLANTGTSNIIKKFTLTCYNSIGKAASSSVEVTVKPQNCGSCNYSGTSTCGYVSGTDSCGVCTKYLGVCSSSTPSPVSVGSCRVDSVRAISSDTGETTISSNGFDRINRYLNGSYYDTIPTSTDSQTTSTNLTGSATFTPPKDNTTATPNHLICLRGGTTSATANCDGTGYWRNSDTGCRCNCSSPYTQVNVFDQQHEGGVCWVPPGSEEPAPLSATIWGNIYLRECPTCPLRLAPATQNNSEGWDFFYYWIYNSSGRLTCSVNDGLYCQTGFQSLYGYVAGADNYMGEVQAQNDNYVNIERNDVTPMNWSFGWKPVGYINYQYPDNVSKEDPNPACGSGGPYEGQCDRVPDYTKCRDNNNSYKSEFRNFGDNNVIRGDYPNNAARVAIFCMPEDNNARIDLVFEKELYTISGKVFFGTNADGIKQSTESYYNSNTKNVINLTGTATSARPTDANGIYSFTKLKPGNYTVIFNPVPNGYQLTTTNPVIVNNLNSDRIIDFGLGPTPWLQTIDGDVHSNTQINAPGGP